MPSLIYRHDVCTPCHIRTLKRDQVYIALQLIFSRCAYIPRLPIQNIRLIPDITITSASQHNQNVCIDKNMELKYDRKKV